jgi:hypothetical protein
MTETQQFPDHLMSSLCQEGDNDESSFDIELDNSEADDSSEHIPTPMTLGQRQYPPQGKMAEEMTRYLFEAKTIPAAIETSLKSRNSFIKR